MSISRRRITNRKGVITRRMKGGQQPYSVDEYREKCNKIVDEAAEKLNINNSYLVSMLKIPIVEKALFDYIQNNKQ